MKRWLKLDATWPHGQTARRILDEFGIEGLTVWTCLLSAAKRHVPEGEFTFVASGWAELGLAQHPPGFELDAFLRLTGQLKQTRRTRSGHVSNVVLTHWEQWQDEWRRDSERERKSRTRRGSGWDTLRTSNGKPADEKRTEKEIEIEKEKETQEARVREIYNHWRTARRKSHASYEKISDNRRTKITARLKEFTPADLHKAIDAVALDTWPERDRNDDLTLLFRNQESVNRWLVLADDLALQSHESRVRDHLASLKESA